MGVNSGLQTATKHDSLFCALVNLWLKVNLLPTKARHEETALSDVGPVEAFTTAWRKSFTYGGKATRAEYWWFYLLNLIVTFVVMMICSFLVGGSPPAYAGHIYFLIVAYFIAQIFPSLSIVFRRLRDIGKEWFWIFISLVPFIGGIWFIILMCQPSGRYETNEASNG